MDEGKDSVSSPFWLQTSTHHHRRLRTTLSSLFLNSGLLIFILCLTAVIFMFFIIPSIVSFTSQIFKPNLGKKSWESVNVVLVVVALAFGFLSRNRNHDYSTFDENYHRNISDVRNEIQKSNPSTPRQWYEYSNRTVYSSSSGIGAGLRRNSCSYPDLREESSWVKTDDRWRFSDDIQVESHRYPHRDQFRRSWKQVDEEEGKIINVVDPLVTRDKEESYTPPHPLFPTQPTSPAPPTSPPVVTVRRKLKRRYETVARKEQLKGSESTETLTSQVMTPSPQSPPPLPIDSEKSSKRERKRSGSNATKELFTSIYNQKTKKTKQRQKSVDNFETLLQSQDRPPPPPPPSVLHNLFSSKKGKSKKIISIPPSATTVHASKATSLIVPISAHQPSLPLKTSNFQSLEEINSNSGGASPLTGCESPLIPIPPPPPPPPFKMRSWRFVVKGDYVRVGSMNSSRSVSPDDSPRSEISSEAGGTPNSEAAVPLFCLSPDVDAKADMFIANFRAGLKLQKMNSMIRKKQGLGLSNLGPETKRGAGS